MEKKEQMSVPNLLMTCMDKIYKNNSKLRYASEDMPSVSMWEESYK